ncbi:MAG: DUF1667 domain-containing protein [Clostridiales bacterium]|nr:DUF1667 domain-containing protein [Clostridiales bacterium]
MIELICIECPKGCRLKVEEDGSVTGQACARGLVYGREEARNPVRVVTSTVRIEGGVYRRCPVKTNGRIPKSLMREAVQALDELCLRSPVRAGQVVVANVCGAGVDFVAVRDM